MSAYPTRWPPGRALRLVPPPVDDSEAALMRARWTRLSVYDEASEVLVRASLLQRLGCADKGLGEVSKAALAMVQQSHRGVDSINNGLEGSLVDRPLFMDKVKQARDWYADCWPELRAMRDRLAAVEAAMGIVPVARELPAVRRLYERAVRAWGLAEALAAHAGCIDTCRFGDVSGALREAASRVAMWAYYQLHGDPASNPPPGCLQALAREEKVASAWARELCHNVVPLRGNFGYDIANYRP